MMLWYCAMTLYARIIENGREKLAEEGVPLNGHFHTTSALRDRIACAREAIAVFTTSLAVAFNNGESPQGEAENAQLDAYVDGVESLVVNLAKVQMRSTKPVGNNENIRNFSDDQIRELTFEFSSQLQDVIGLLTRERGAVTERDIRNAVIPLRHYNVQFLRELRDDPEFAELYDTPKLFQFAVAGHVSDPRAFLRRELVMRMKNDPEFAVLRHVPRVFAYAALHHKDDPRSFLKKFLVDYDELLHDSEFEPLHDIPEVFMVALIHGNKGPDAPRMFLRGILSEATEMENDEKYAELRDIPKIFTHFAAHYGTAGYHQLSMLMFFIEGLKKIEEFSEMVDTPEIFKYAVIRHRKDPVKFLRKVVQTIKKLETDKEFAGLRHIPNIYKYAAIYFVKDPAAFLRKTAADLAKGIEPAHIDRASILAEITQEPLPMLTQKDQLRLMHELH